MSISPKTKGHHRAKSSSPIKSRFENCPVSDPKIGIISENDHRVGLCLCKYCECGQHTCPNPLTKELYPSSTFTSKYNADFKRGSFDQPLKPEPKAYRPNALKMDFRTTNKEDFKPFSVSPKKDDFKYPMPLKVNSPSRSAYSNDFLDWGATNVYLEKRFQPPLRSQEIPFRGQSSYQKYFINIDPLRIELYKTNISDLAAFNSTITLGSKNSQSFKTTYSEKMQDFSKNELNKIIKVSNGSNGANPNFPSQYMTTSQNFYQNHLPESKDPRKVRLALNKRIR